MDTWYTSGTELIVSNTQSNQTQLPPALGDPLAMGDSHLWWAQLAEAAGPALGISLQKAGLSKLTFVRTKGASRTAFHSEGTAGTVSAAQECHADKGKREESRGQGQNSERGALRGP